MWVIQKFGYAPHNLEYVNKNESVIGIAASSKLTTRWRQLYMKSKALFIKSPGKKTQVLHRCLSINYDIVEIEIYL